MKIKIPFLLVAGLSGLFFLASCTKTPDACFNQDKTTASIGEEIKFTDCSKNGSSDYTMNMGNGTTLTDGDQSFPVLYGFPRPGTFTVTYKVFSENGKKSDEVTLSVTITPPVTADFLGTWDLYKIEEQDPFFGIIDSWDPDQTYTFTTDTVSISNSWGATPNTWSLNADDAEISIGTAIFTVHKIHGDEMVLLTGEIFEEYYYFRKQ